MKLFILGGTGPTGYHLLNEALQKGHEVVAFCRSPGKITIQHEKLMAVKGDVMSANDLADQMTGCDAVLSCLGATEGMCSAVTLYTDTAASIAQAMKMTGVKRFVVMSSWGTRHDKELPFVWKYILLPTFLRNTFYNMREMEDFLTTRACAHMNWTVVKAAQLTTEPSKGGEIQEAMGELVLGPVTKISRQDVAIFMLQTLETDFYDGKRMAISGPRRT